MTEGRHDDPSLGLDDQRRGLDDQRRGLDDQRRLLDDPSRVRADGVIDARGLRCPAPIILLARAARAGGSARADGAARVLTVWWTDPAARTDIAAWARMRGHEVLGTEPLAGPVESADDDRAYAPGDASGRVSTAASSSSDSPAYATRVRLTRTA